MVDKLRSTKIVDENFDEINNKKFLVAFTNELC